jgi:hypothetical protein
MPWCDKNGIACGIPANLRGGLPVPPQLCHLPTPGCSVCDELFDSSAACSLISDFGMIIPPRACGAAVFGGFCGPACVTGLRVGESPRRGCDVAFEVSGCCFDLALEAGSLDPDFCGPIDEGGDRNTQQQDADQHQDWPDESLDKAEDDSRVLHVNSKPHGLVPEALPVMLDQPGGREFRASTEAVGSRDASRHLTSQVITVGK